MKEKVTIKQKLTLILIMFAIRILKAYEYEHQFKDVLKQIDDVITKEM